MTAFLRRRLLGAALLAISAAGLTACDSAPGGAARPGIADALLASVSGDVPLTASQQASLGAAFGTQRPTPGFTWVLADSLRRTLTAAQKATLLARTDSSALFRGLLGHPGAGFNGLGGFIGSTRRHGVAGADSVLNLSAEQQARVQALHTAYRAAVKALRDGQARGAAPTEAFLREMVRLSAQLTTDVSAVLTAEQTTALAAFRARREAVLATMRAQANAVRDRVLGLTGAQGAQFNTILDAQMAAREVLVEQFQAGTLTLAQYQTQVAALAAARTDALRALLSAAQFETTQLHEALAARGHGKGFGGPGGPGGRHRGNGDRPASGDRPG